jgi:hypothetical protein
MVTTTSPIMDLIAATAIAAVVAIVTATSPAWPLPKTTAMAIATATATSPVWALPKTMAMVLAKIRRGRVHASALSTRTHTRTPTPTPTLLHRGRSLVDGDTPNRYLFFFPHLWGPGKRGRNALELERGRSPAPALALVLGRALAPALALGSGSGTELGLGLGTELGLGIGKAINGHLVEFRLFLRGHHQ